MAGLIPHGDDWARCKHCGVQAVGPCARCRGPVCGDCCVLTEHTATPWAICIACARRGGSSLRAAWFKVLGWFLVPIVVLALLVAALATAANR